MTMMVMGLSFKTATRTLLQVTLGFLTSLKADSFFLVFRHNILDNHFLIISLARLFVVYRRKKNEGRSKG